MNKKTQMELMGLSILMIIIFLGLTFFLVTFKKIQPKSAYNTYKVQVTSSNFVSTILNVNTKCNSNHPQLMNLLTDCVSQTSAIKCNGGTESSCQYANETITKMLNKTLDKMNIAYQMNITLDNSQGSNYFVSTKQIYFRSHNCKTLVNAITVPYTLQLGINTQGRIMIMLYICKNT